MLDKLEVLGGYFQLEFSNGTIDCPDGSGVKAGERDLQAWVQDNVSTRVEDSPFGNWCTFNCKHPRVLMGNYDNVSSGVDLYSLIADCIDKANQLFDDGM